jgi:enoyl-CoA hydratase/carnithine racemase
MLQRTIETPSPRLYALIENTVASVIISAPERRNCVDLATWKAFPALFASLETDPTIRCIILRGEGSQAFCAGADISEFETARATSEGSRSYELENVRAFEAVSQISKPVIAMIHGFCFGAGVGLAAACDIRMAADDALFAIPAAVLGVGYPPTAIKSLVALMGPEPVRHLFYTAGRLDAMKAHEMGLVGEVVPKAALENRVTDLAKTISSGAPLTISAAKRAIDAAAGLPGALDNIALQALADACFQSEDYAEGRSAFRDKRKPLFKGS